MKKELAVLQKPQPLWLTRARLLAVVSYPPKNLLGRYDAEPGLGSERLGSTTGVRGHVGGVFVVGKHLHHFAVPYHLYQHQHTHQEMSSSTQAQLQEVSPGAALTPKRKVLDLVSNEAWFQFKTGGRGTCIEFSLDPSPGANPHIVAFNHFALRHILHAVCLVLQRPLQL